MTDERIKELAEQAGLKHHNWITNESNVKDGDFKYPRLEDYEKFAELIVRECVQVCADRGKHHDGLYSAWADDCSKRIGKHFGVEK